MSWIPPTQKSFVLWCSAKCAFDTLVQWFFILKEIYLHFFAQNVKINLYCQKMFVPLPLKGYNITFHWLCYRSLGLHPPRVFLL